MFVAVKNDLVCAHRQDLDSNCEIVWVQIQLAGSKVLNIGAFYRPPNVTDPKYLEELRDSLSKFKNSHKGHIWLGGDFNFGGIDWPTKTTIPGAPNKTLCHKFIDMMDDYNLEQEVREPTRKDKILDLFFTNNSTLVEKSTVIPGLSDHDGIAMITVGLSPHICHQKPHKVFLYKKGDNEGMRKELNDFCENFPLKDANQSDVESLWCQFKTKLLETMDTHIPSKLVSTKNKPPWINTTVQMSLRKKQRAFNRAKKSQDEADWESFRDKRKDSHKETRNAYRRYIRKFCVESNKNFWSFVKKLKKDSTGIPALKDQGVLISENIKKAEILNKQFKSVFTTEDMDSIPDPHPSRFPPIPNITISTNGIEKLLQNLNPNKATGPDGIPPRILKEFAKEIAPILSIIYQASIDTGHLPADWKTANISPIYKKSDRTKASNYRPVSLTSVPCKVLEHVVHSHIMKHFNAHNILTSQQHGFRAAHSCETQLIQTIHDFATSRNNLTQTDVIIMDFSKRSTAYHIIVYCSN